MEIRMIKLDGFVRQDWYVGDAGRVGCAMFYPCLFRISDWTNKRVTK